MREEGFIFYKDGMQGNIVFVGAGGAGLSNLVGILRDLGFHNLIGIDEQDSQITQQLSDKGIQIFKHGRYHIKSDDAVIYSAATKDSLEVLTSKELKRAEHKPLLIWDYFEFLGEMTKYFKSIGFTGTNGKSSSSAMGIHIASKCLPNFGIGIVGALVPDFGGKSYMLNLEHKDELKNIFDYIFTGRKLNYELIKKYYFLLESCEYQRHFLHLNLDNAIISSLELEHTDYFTDWDDYQDAFIEMIGKTKNNVYCLEDLNCDKVISLDKVIKVKKTHFDMNYVWGEHQQGNASLVCELLKGLMESEGIAAEAAEKSIHNNLKDFRGTWRRMEFLKETEKGVLIFSDYGHVASSIGLGYKALKERFPDKKLICIFQPHQIHRILQGWNEFPTTISLYHESYVYDIYAAREHIEDFTNEELFKELNLTSVKDLGEAFSKHCNSSYLDNFNEIKKIIENSDSDSLIVIYSAGNIDFKLRQYLEIL